MEEDINNVDDRGLLCNTENNENVFNLNDIKIEPEDYDEHEQEIEEQMEYEYNEYYVPRPNKIILGKKPATQASLQPAPENSTAPTNEVEQNSFQCDECGIVVSAQTELDAHTTSHSYVVARPCNSILKSILCLPSDSAPNTERTKESREDTSHIVVRSFNNTLENVLCAVSEVGNTSTSSALQLREDITKGIRQDAMKSTMKSPLNSMCPLAESADSAQIHSNADEDTPDEIVSNDSDKHFSAEIEHTHEVLKKTVSTPENVLTDSDEMMSSDSDVRSDEIKATRGVSQKTFVCDICELSFKSSYAMRGHKGMHYKKPNLTVTHPKKIFVQCPYCSIFLNHSTRMAAHILKHHNAEHPELVVANFSGKCAFCARPMMHYLQYNSHIQNSHPKKYNSTEMLKSATRKPVSYKCALCNEVFSSMHAAYKHKSLKHSYFWQRNTFMFGTQKTNSKSKNLSLSHAVIPKQTLFKCNNCQIHFVTCSTALEHSKHCVRTKGDWKCHKCRLIFTRLEKPIHTLQHNNSNKFKVHVVDDKLIRKVICCCPKCKLHFDEIAFWKHVSAGCVSELDGVDCNICNLKMHPASMFKHIKYHSKYSLTPTDYIVIQFLTASIEMASISKKQTINKRNMVSRYGKRTLYFCKNCKSHTYTRKDKNFHLSRTCQASAYKKINCTVCGLLFPAKTYKTHLLDHRLHKFTLNDYIFVGIQDNKAIDPLLAEFRKCDKCEVRFLLLVDKKWHNCKMQKWIKCSKCSHKFDSDLYDVHLRLHENESEAEDVDPSSRECVFFLFSCVSCNYGFDSYDSLVEHCQDHYAGTEFLNTSPCKVCKLNYTGIAKRRHHQVHSNDANFKILKFDYNKLLHEDWSKAFDSVPREKTEQILSKSLYGGMRNIRLNLLTHGPSERSLYRCAQCKLCFEMKNVVEHAKEPCSNSSRYNCEICNTLFPTKDLANQHNEIHNIFGDDTSFRRVEFNHDGDKGLNELLRTGKKKESLKFKKCQHCDVLIKMEEFHDHVENHEKHNAKSKIIKDKRGRYTIYEPISIIKRMYKAYQCLHCKCSITRRANILRHNCRSSPQMDRCSKCSLFVLSLIMHRHKKIHLKLPNFVTKNITVLEFEIHSNVNNVTKNKNHSLEGNRTLDFRKAVITRTYETRKTGNKFYADSLLDSDDSQDTFIESIARNEPKANDSKNLSSLTQWKIELRSKLYQCNKCYMCFALKELLENHLSKCVSNSSEPPLKCNRCEIIFHPSLETFHEKLHALVVNNPLENYFFIIHISSKQGKHAKKQWLFQCKICDLHFLQYNSLLYHFNNNHEYFNDYVPCDICGLKFTANSRTRHKSAHHKGKKPNNNISVEIVEKKFIMIGEFKLSKEVPGNDDDNGVTITEITENETTDISLQKYNEKDVAIPNPNTPHHYENDASNTVSVTDVVESNKRVSKEINNVNTDNGDDVPINESSASSVYTDDLPLTRMNKSHETKKQMKMLKMYQCIHCRICVGRYEKKFHVCCSDIQKKHCIKCSLSFRNTDFNQHLKLHQKFRLPKKNIVLVKFERSKIKNSKIIKCVKCSTHFFSTFAYERHLDVKNHQTQREYCKICGLFFGKFSLSRHVHVHHKQLKLTNKQLNIVNASTTDITPSNTQDTSGTFTSTPNNATINESTNQHLIQMFRCFECDVYFLTEFSYYQHLYKHSELDPTEYIACKMCKMQFMTDELGAHMKTHRDKTFNLEIVLIHGYQPNDGSPKIETYLAVDGLISKTVNTTTPFVNEIGTASTNVEQLSAIDSTSAKLQ